MSEFETVTTTSELLVELAADVVSAYVANNPVPVADLPGLIADVHAALGSIGRPAESNLEQPKPAVNPKRSVHDDYIVCLEDGKRFKTLKRHLTTHFLTPEQYRQKWNLGSSYPMVAPNYAATRSQLAQKIGFGRKPSKSAGRKGGAAK